MVRVVFLGIVTGFCLTAVGCGAPRPADPVAGIPERIVSLSPGLTETVFSIGAGHRIVGVTRYCIRPEGKDGIAEVGGYLDPNWEAIVAVRPDLVLLMESQAGAEERAASLGLRAARFDQHDLASVLESFEAVAEICGVPEEGFRLRRAVEADLERVRSGLEGCSKPRVLAVIGREAGSGRLRSVWAAGSGTFLGDVVEYAGGENVLGEEHVGAYPEISREGLIQLDPDVVLDVFPDLSERGLSVAAVLKDWQDFKTLGAIRSGRVHVLAEPFMTVPGPRVARVVEAVAEALHPECGR